MLSLVKRLVYLCIAASVFFVPFALAADLDSLSRINLRPGVTEISQAIFGLHTFVIWVCVGIAVVVYGVMFYSIFKFRRSKGAQAASFSHSTKAELAWTAIPIILLVLMGIPSVKVLAKMYNTEASKLDILVTGYQWRWSYEYLDDGVKFFSNLASENPDGSIRNQIDNKDPKDATYLLNVDNPLVIPTNTKVRFLVTANDVLHSWWVPDFAIKRDAVPGYINEAWTNVQQEGTYRGQCAELCGKDHGFMPIVVQAVGQQQFDNWMASKKAEMAADNLASTQAWTEADLLARGEAVYSVTCLVCHQAQGQGIPPAFPALAGSTKVNAELATTLDIVLRGVPNSAMQPFGPQLNDVDIAAVVTYIRASWSNAPADGAVAQPQDVAKLR